MEALRTSDPARLAGHRLLGRLGAGGMGVVYLARSAGGNLVALKVIQAEYAEDTGFRERFRREAETARRMTSPWVAALVDADPEAEQPWLATVFVPGPSLAEAVAAHGPLPVRSLRALGARLAHALGDLHAAGLVHRDVKPGNILLAPDGPRLIDFGVARAPEDTSLTSTGVVVGTPGFLPPEQTRGGRELGPAGDVFSLGCVLVHAATGRPPFGTGTAEALLFRTVHDAPDLDGLPEELAEIVGGCLEKEPGLRPTAEELAEALGAAVPSPSSSQPSSSQPADTDTDADPAAAPDAAAPSDPREAFRAVRPDAAAGGQPGDRPPTDAPPTDAPPAKTPPTDASPVKTPPTDASPAEAPPTGPPPAGESWLPEPLLRMIAERSAAGLALPGIDDTEVDPASATAPGTSGGGPRRRRFLLLAAGAAAVAAGGGVAAWAALRDDDGTPAGAADPAATAGKPVHTLGLHADLSGDHRALGRAQERGLRLAVEEFNAAANRPFTLAVRTVDDGGDPDRAVAAAEKLVGDRSVLAVIGPTTDTTALATVPTYDAASLPLIAVTPGGSALGALGSRSFLQARVTDTIMPFYLRAYLRGTAKSKTVGILDDRAADAYAWEISSTLAKLLRDDRQPAVPKVVSALRTDFRPALDALDDGGADSVVFAGYHDRAALLARELTSRDFPGARTAAHGVLDERFLSAAGDAAEGWVIVAPVLDAAAVPEAKAFTAAYRKRFGTGPERYAVETYDVARMTAESLRSLAAGERSRQNLVTALRAAAYQGITKKFAFDKVTGTLVIDGTGVHLWKVDGGRFAYQGVASFEVSA